MTITFELKELATGRGALQETGRDSVTGRIFVVTMPYFPT